MHATASLFSDLLVEFRPAFTRPSFDRFRALTPGWLLCPGRHPVSRVVQFAQAVGETGHLSTF